MAKKISRRRFVATAAGAAIAAANAGGGMAAREARRPNILVIHADQHRFDCLGASGNPDLRTPNIDSLAADAVRFENSFCPYPVCTPSRYSLLSGLYVHEHRGWTNRCTLPPDTPTFPAILRQAGYRTAAVGKMHFTPTYLDVGFEDMILAEQDGDGRWDDDYHRALRDAGLADIHDLEDQRQEYLRQAPPEYWRSFGARPSDLPKRWHSTEWIGDRAVEFLDRWGPEGNLLMVGFIKPHHPFDPPAELAGAYDPQSLSLPPGWTEDCLPHDLDLTRIRFKHEDLTEDVLRRITACYYATIQHIDEQVGRMLAVLRRKGLYDDTLVVYTSDHGEYLGYHHLILKNGYMYDPLVKVPLLLKFPGGARRGTASSELVSNVDVAPTLLRQAGCTPAPGMGGHDLSQPGPFREVVLAEAHEGKQEMARTKTRKLLRHRGKGTILLYDLEKDPFERENRADDPAYAADRKRLSAAIDAWRDPDRLPEPYVNEDAPRIDRPNVPRRNDGHREAMAAYFHEKWEESRR